MNWIDVTRWLGAILLWGCLGALPAQSYFIETVAGGGTGDGGLATSASVNYPKGAAVDSAGNLYIADRDHNLIRKVAAGTGIISTVAGNGWSGFSGDGGPATSASFIPNAVAVDGAGNLYIADWLNYRIRKVAASTGIISTVAGNGTYGFSGDGGPATSASLSFPGDVAVDNDGNLYVADLTSGRIRKVVASTGIISTVAGNGTFDFSGDGGPATSASLAASAVAVDNAGNLYIADLTSGRIRKVVASTGIISTVAGNGTFDFSGDGGPATSAGLTPIAVAVDGAGNLYIADQGSNRIRKVDSATGIISSLAGNGTYGFSGDDGPATSASLNRSQDVTVDGAGNVYIADSENNRIRKVAAGTGIINTVAGNGSKVFTGDDSLATSASLGYSFGVAVDGAGNLYIADAWNNRIRKVAASTGIISAVAGNGTYDFSGDGGAATSASLRGPEGVAVDSAGNLYVAERDSNRIRKVDGTTEIISSVAGTGTPGFSGDGGAAISASLRAPQRVAVDGAGNLYIADTWNGRIRKVAASTGIISTVAGDGSSGFNGDDSQATLASLYFPQDVAVDGAGNLYIADELNHRVRKVAASTGIVSTVAGNGTSGFSGDGGAATSASLSGLQGVAVDSAGNLYVADSGNHRIRKVAASTGIISTIAGNGWPSFSGDGKAARSASLNYPTSVAVDGAGNLYVADANNRRIRRLFDETTARRVQFASAMAKVSEAADHAIFKVNRVGLASGPASVAYSTADGTAVAGTDYAATFGTLNWADGDTTGKTISVPLIHHSLGAPEKTFGLALSSPSGVELLAPSNVMVTLYNNVPTAPFTDISGNWATSYINAIYGAGITTGCGNGLFCGSQNVTREQMAAFIIRAVETDPVAGYCGSNAAFSDVPANHPFCGHIKRMAELGITTGCGSGNYCPSQTVTREQLAAFIVRALEGNPVAGYCGSTSPFSDVTASSAFCGHIKRMLELNITTGCGGDMYCPSQTVTRDQMAAFLARAFLSM